MLVNANLRASSQRIQVLLQAKYREFQEAVVAMGKQLPKGDGSARKAREKVAARENTPLSTPQPSVTPSGKIVAPLKIRISTRGAKKKKGATGGSSDEEAGMQPAPIPLMSS